MTRKATLTVNGLSISYEQHKTLGDAIASWVQDTAHSCDRFNRNFTAGETSVRIQLSGISKTEIQNKLDTLDTAVSNLPGDWPVPSEQATLRPE